MKIYTEKDKWRLENSVICWHCNEQVFGSYIEVTEYRDDEQKDSKYFCNNYCEYLYLKTELGGYND